MKILAKKFKNSALLFSLTALASGLAACGNMSASISQPPSSSAFQQKQKEQLSYDSIETNPLHDMGGGDYEDFAQQQDFEQTPVDSSQGGDVLAGDDKSADPKSNDSQTTDSTPAPSPKPTTPDHKVIETGMIKPTVYYFPVYNEDRGLCDKGDVKTLHGTNGEKIINACPKTLVACGLQGSCAIIQKGVRRSFNISDRVSGQDRYFEMTNTECRYGYGVRSACLDPFYTVAADLDVYKPGDVIFIPAAVGLKLPDGTTHNGYFIVRDQGRGINGKGRFDFYSGFLSWMDSKNPFRKLNFEDMKTQVPYAKIIGAKAEQVLKSRAYPKLPMPPLK